MSRRRTKRIIAEWICKRLGVEICPPIIDTIHIKNCMLQGELDLSSTVLGKNVCIDVSHNPNLTSIAFPTNQISEKTIINLNGEIVNK